MSFFEESAFTQKAPIVSTIPKCGACGLDKQCNSPKMKVTGKGKKGILIVAEAPGEREDDEGVQLIGKAGQFLRKALRRFDIDLDTDCWKTNSLICRPPDNRTPTNAEIDYCRPNLTKAIEELKPRVICPLGAAAVRSLLGPLWRDDTGSISDWVGWNIPLQRWNCWICPTYHPSYILRMEEKREGPAAEIWFGKHLEKMSELKGRPWETVPNYASEVKIIMDPDQATNWIDSKLKTKTAFSIDYETTSLKPDSPWSEIVSCGICAGGKDTIAYPWAGSAIDATRRLLVSDNPKIGANTKFEDRWSKRHLGVFVNNWVWDAMLSAHHLDNRTGISSVKFQAFVRLGLSSYNDAVAPYFEASDANSKNRVREIDLPTLLRYNGIDALVEYLISQKQRQEMMFENLGE